MTTPDFMLQQARRYSAGQTQLIASALRSFFRFLLQQGLITTDLAQCVPTPARRRLSSLPGFISADDVECLLHFNAQCKQTKSVIQQTEPNFLKPPTQRSKARYHHIAPRIEWAQKVLRYQQRGDFHLIDARYCVDDDAFQFMALPSSYWHLLAPI